MDKLSYEAASARYAQLVEAELAAIRLRETGRIHPRLLEAMFYSVEGGGKRIRPSLVLAVCEMLGGSLKNAMPIACGLEMIHTYSLIHDDLPCMDDDDMRRGRPSNHKVFGEAEAVLAGDGLLSLAFEVMLRAAAESGDPGILAAAYEAAQRAGAAGMVSGQSADMELEGAANPTGEMLRYVHRHKTADMLEAAVVAGALTAGADAGVLEKLRRYSAEMGLLFQITDDLLDATGDQELMGKTLGKDAKQGKLTYVTLLGIDGAKREAEAAERRAEEAISGLENADYLLQTVRRMLTRSR
ncbi:MAG: polyprenyl synthetase family protein [Clostridia bacterium]|nr:polyprenyl synthetase family protein [Clostridia bacterium]